ncbi:MAG: response regulator [Candidatus Heimdallarchaeota archaeon]
MGLKAKILVIDDNEIIRTLLQELLTRNGYETYVAVDGNSAIELLETVKPHLALVDLMLPDISGIEVIKHIRNISPSTESIIITGHSSYDATKEILSSYIACGLLEKPLDVNKLLDTIKKVLKRHESQIQIEEDLDEITRINYQLDFFNTILFRDFKILTEALAGSIELLKDDNLTEKQQRSLAIINTIYYNNTRLIHCYKKMKTIHTIDPDEFICIDIVLTLRKVISALCEADVDCQIDQLNEFSDNEIFVLGTDKELNELFYELFFSMIMPGLLNQIIIDLDLKKTNSLTNEEEQNIPTVELKLTVESDNKPKMTGESITEFESQKYGLGFYIVKNIVDLFNGKIFLEDSKENGKLITTIVIFLPACNKE